MSLIIKSEYELKKFLDLGLSPSPIVITKGNYYSIINYNEIPGEYKNVLTAANQDYLIVNESLNWANVSDIDIQITWDDSGYVTGTPTIFSKGQSNPTSGGVILRRNNSGALRFRYANIDSSFTNINYSGIPLGKHTLIIKNLKVTIDGLDEPDLIDGPINVEVGAFPLSIGKLSYASSAFLDGPIFDFKLGNESFELNEPSGSLFTGSSGTTGTRNTSSLDPDYIDNVMIQPVYE